MDAGLLAGLQADAVTEVLLFTIKISDTVTIRWTDGGFVVWDGQTYAARDTVYGVLSTISEFEDGVGREVTNASMEFYPPDSDGYNLWIAAGVQGAPMTVHLGVVDRVTGLLVGEPDLRARFELDNPSIGGVANSLKYSLITEEARMLEPNDERRATDIFHQLAWPGERGMSNVTGLTLKRYWRAERPNNAIVS